MWSGIRALMLGLSTRDLCGPRNEDLQPFIAVDLGLYFLRDRVRADSAYCRCGTNS